MSRTKVACPHCGASNVDGADWCSRCLKPLGSKAATRSGEAAPQTLVPPATGRRSRTGWIVVAVLAVVLVAVSWRAVDVVNDHSRLNPETIPGPPDPRGFKFLELDPETGRPARFDPCTPMHYVVNVSHAPPSALEDVEEAARLASEATGVEIVFDGTTTEAPSGQRDVYLPDLYGERWPPVLIGWIPSDPRIFQEHDVGVAASDPVENDSGDLVYVTGSMILNSDRELSSGFEAGRTWGKVIIHEWGHLLGLDHVENTTQVMNGSLVSSPARWGTGDEAGLRALGRSAGCLDQPELP